MSIQIEKRNGMHLVNPTLTIGEMDAELYIQIAIDGEVIIEKRADSLLVALIRIMMACMGGIPTLHNGIALMYVFASTPDWVEIFSENSKIISTAATYNTVETLITTSTTNTYVVGTELMLFGFTGDWAACNGLHAVLQDVSTTQVSIAVNSSAFGAITYTEIPSCLELRDGGTYMPHSSILDQTEIWLGKSNTAVAIDDKVLGNFIALGTDPGELEWTDSRVDPAPVAIGTGTSEMTFSRDFTNNSGSTIAIEEAGLFTSAMYQSAGSQDYWTIGMIARDLVSTTLANGATATVSYKVKTALDSQGGFTEQLLRSWAAQAVSQNVTNVEGNPITNANEALLWRMAAPSGNNRAGTSLANEDPEWVGPQIGTGNTAVTISDYALETRVGHGDGSDLTCSGTTGNLVININAVNYTEAFATDITVTVVNWLATHAATLAGLGTPVIATIPVTGTVHLTSTGVLVYIDNSTGDIAFTVASQVKYYGGLVENLLINDTPGEASFDIVRIFENNSGSTISVKEVGLYYSPDGPPYVEQYMLTRHVLTAPITLLTTEFLKLTHTIKVVL